MTENFFNWRAVLSVDWGAIDAFLASEYAAGALCPPRKIDVFRSLFLIAPSDVRIVVVGQDPYPNAGDAHGLAFSVPYSLDSEHKALPKSLKQIYGVIESNGFKPDVSCGDLTRWVSKGVLLWNTFLTCKQGESRSHAKIWSDFGISRALFEYLNTLEQGIIFLLWGADAKNLGKLITNTQHTVLSAAHPGARNPLALADAFQTCTHFRQASDILQTEGITFNWE
ncbi:MAG: uracil-DNA glycosylase [Oscillospiraceae bacterium]|jgi:uracil-DNA glycosylase|nr:uracil-DNA glycosylase [Oscillospiraceae bacterium]